MNGVKMLNIQNNVSILPFFERKVGQNIPFLLTKKVSAIALAGLALLVIALTTVVFFYQRHQTKIKAEQTAESNRRALLLNEFNLAEKELEKKTAVAAEYNKIMEREGKSGLTIIDRDQKFAEKALKDLKALDIKAKQDAEAALAQAKLDLETAKSKGDPEIKILLDRLDALIKESKKILEDLQKKEDDAREVNDQTLEDDGSAMRKIMFRLAEEKAKWGGVVRDVRQENKLNLRVHLLLN